MNSQRHVTKICVGKQNYEISNQTQTLRTRKLDWPRKRCGYELKTSQAPLPTACRSTGMECMWTFSRMMLLQMKYDNWLETFDDRQTNRHAHAIICHPLLGKKRGFTIWLNLHLLPMSTYPHSVWEASSSTAAGFEPSLRDNVRLHLHLNIQPGEGSMPTNIDSLV